MRITERMMGDTLRSNINRNGESLIELQDQLSSGKRLRKPSDDPQALSRALTLRRVSDETNQYIRNIDIATGWMEASDSALNQLSSVLVKVRNMAVAAASDTVDADQRSQYAEQVKSYIGEGLQTANATHDGRYIFAGALTNGRYNSVTGEYDPPFVITPTIGGTTSSVTYQGDTSAAKTIKTDVGHGVTIDTNMPGDFQVNGAGVLEGALTSMNDLAKALASNDVSGVKSALDSISTSISGVLSVRGVVGARMTRLDSTSSAYSNQQTNTAEQLSKAQDADVAELMTKLTTQQTVYTSALKAGAKVLQVSLMDYLS